MNAMKPIRLDHINALRAIAALSVCWFHFVWHIDPAGPLFQDGAWVKQWSYNGLQGVYIFFIISGCVIPLSMDHAKYTLAMWPHFMARRLIRLQPPYFGAIALVGIMAFIHFLSGAPLPSVNWSQLLHHVFFTAAFFHQPWYLDVFWTLAIEFQYYIVIALIYPLLAHRKVEVRTLSWLALLYSTTFFGHDLKHVFFFHSGVFAIGVLFWWYYTQRIHWTGLLFFGVLAMVETAYEIGPETAWACLFTFVAMLLWKKKDRITQWLGDISYSVYLTHGFSGGQFLWYVSPLCKTEGERWLALLAAMVVSVGGAWLFYHAIEVPAIRWSKRLNYSGNWWKVRGTSNK
jgi:peptidoglycan/LPS O-acetylase OafA/YrhL